MACSLCKGYGHVRSAHRQHCIICGGGGSEVKVLADIKPEFRCDDEAMHSRIREGFGNTELVKVRDDTSGKMRAS